MKYKKVLATLALMASVLALTSCQSASTNSTTAVSAEAETETTVTASDIVSTVTLDDAYWSGTTVRIRMLFDTEGNCRYGYIGYYDLQTSDDGYPILTLIYYADTDADQMASATFALRDNEDGTYSKTLYTEDDGADFDDSSVTMDLTLSDGDDGIMDGSLFDGVYLATDGRYYTFHSDGTFQAEIWMQYVADEEYLVLIGSDDSTLYTYDLSSDGSSLVLYKNGSTVMTMVTDSDTDTSEDSEESEEADESDEEDDLSDE